VTRAHERMIWLLRYMVTVGSGRAGSGFLVAWDEATVDAFVRAFPEAEKTLRWYLMGPNSSPMLNRAAKRAERLGYLRAGHIGNQDARQYNQRTWCRTWSITDAGRHLLLPVERRSA
jgi:ribosomal protein S10